MKKKLPITVPSALVWALVFALASCPNPADPGGDPSPAETAAEALKAAHSAVLAKTVEDIAVTDESAVDAALAAYEALSAEAKALLGPEKALLDNLKAKIAGLGRGLITLVFDAASGELPEPISLSKLNNEEKILTVSGDFDSCRWRVDGLVKGNGKTFTLKAADYSTGLHQISVELTRDGAAYSKSGSFTVTN